MRRIRTVLSVVLLSFVLASSGCSTTEYFWQAGRGQLELINRARPIAEVEKDETTPPRTKELLAEIPKIKKYGESQGLKPTPNYQDYVKLDRPAAVWVVSACDSLRFVPRKWTFPIVGSFPYLGWFDLKNAHQFADQLRTEGLDVDVRGARAYSTLGWFRDSVLSSMISDGPEALGDLVNVVIHESVHATLYVSGQSPFDESLASFAADRMTPEYLKETRGKDSEWLKAYVAYEKESEEIERILHETYDKLDRLYSSSIPDSEKLAKKAAILAEAKNKTGLKRDLNNAMLVQYRTYSTDTPLFEELFRACGQDWKRFMGTLQNLNSKSFPEAQTDKLEPVLRPLITSGCPLKAKSR